MALNKVAVDPTAEKYWTEYFEELGYGEDLVRKLPRRIASAFEARLAETRNYRVLASEIIPHAARVEGGKILLEGTYAAKVAKVGSKSTSPLRRTFRATVDGHGRIERMQVG